MRRKRRRPVGLFVFLAVAGSLILLRLAVWAWLPSADHVLTTLGRGLDATARSLSPFGR
jgi:hypothetical protein